MTLLADPPRLRSAKISTVEFWRMLFTILVCLYHFGFYFGSPKMLGSGESAVEFFYVLSGFLLAMSAKRDLAGRVGPVSVKEAQAQALDFVKKKLKAIYPILIIVLVLDFLIFPFIGSSSAGMGLFGASKPATFGGQLSALQNTEWELLLLVGSPFGYNNGASPIVPMWFLTNLILVGYIYTFLTYKNYDLMKFLAPLLGVLFYIYFTLNSSLVLDFYVKMGFFTAGMVRALSEMALGMSMFYLYEYIVRQKFGPFWKIVLSIFEVYAIYRFFALTLWQPLGMDNFRRIVYILIIVLLSFSNVTYLSQLLNRPIWRKISKISLAMYLVHFPLVSVYMKLLGDLKMSLYRQMWTSPSARSLLNMLSKTGGYDANFRQIPMSFADGFLFILLVVAVSTLIMLYIAYFRRLVVRPLKTLSREKRAEREPEPGENDGQYLK